MKNQLDSTSIASVIALLFLSIGFIALYLVLNDMTPPVGWVVVVGAFVVSILSGAFNFFKTN